MLVLDRHALLALKLLLQLPCCGAFARYAGSLHGLLPPLDLDLLSCEEKQKPGIDVKPCSNIKDSDSNAIHSSWLQACASITN